MLDSKVEHLTLALQHVLDSLSQQALDENSSLTWDAVR